MTDNKPQPMPRIRWGESGSNFGDRLHRWFLGEVSRRTWERLHQIWEAQAQAQAQADAGAPEATNSPNARSHL